MRGRESPLLGMNLCLKTIRHSVVKPGIRKCSERWSQPEMGLTGVQGNEKGPHNW
jgi:hypothetical protein